MGVVYRATDSTDGREVALKLLERSDSKDRARFEREADVLRAIAHPRVVRYLAHGTSSDGTPYLAMEWLEGRDLAARLREGTLGVRDALGLALAAAEGLHAAHAAGVIHRDMKPSNLLLVGDRLDDVRVIDFGIARTERGGAPMTSTGSVLGTPAYMAPEQLRGEHDVRTDVYGLGATLFEALAGRPPFAGDHPGAVLLAVMAEPSPRLDVLRSDVPLAVDALVGRMLAKHPGDRPGDMRAVVTELTDLLADVQPRRVALTRAERRPRPAARLGGPTSSATLGTPGTPGTQPEMVGRARELAFVRGALEESETEELTTLVTVSGEAGIGKTALLEAVVQARPSSARVLVARAHRAAAGVPFGLLSQLLAAGDVGAAAVTPALATMRALLDLVARPDAGRDIRALSDRMRLVWLELLEGLTDDRALVVIVDDADHGDLASLRYLERGLAHLEELGGRPFALVVSSRARWRDGPLLAHGRSLEIPLGPLGERSTLRLAASLAAAGTSAERVAAAARVSGGNPSHLRELLRAADGERLEGSIAALVWERLSRLDAESRRVLRAASIAGRRFSAAAIASLLGVDASSSSLEERLRALVTRGVARRVSGTGEYELESELVHLAAREMCTEEDLRVGHREMARWLEGTGRADAAEVAHHLAEGGDHAAAAARYLEAARSALAGDDAERVEVLLERGAAAAANVAAGAALQGEIDALRAEAAFWRGDVTTALESSLAALGSIEAGTESWFSTASLAVTVAGQRGDNEGVRRLAERVAATAPAGAAAADARVVGICRAITQLELVVVSGVEDPLWSHVRAASSGPVGPRARAWLRRAEAARAPTRSFEAIEAFVAAHRAHVDDDDARSAAQVSLYLGSYFTWSGAWELARERIDDSLRTSHRLGAAYLETWALYTDGKLQVETAPEDALRILEAVAERSGASPRIRAGALVYAALAAQRASAFEDARLLARRAREAHTAPAVAIPAAAAECRALLALGRHDEASALRALVEPPVRDGAEDAAKEEEPLVEHDELVGLARAELALARGSEATAVRAIARSATNVEARAASLADPVRRNQYLARPHLVRRVLEAARDLGARG